MKLSALSVPSWWICAFIYCSLKLSRNLFVDEKEFLGRMSLR